MTSRRSFRRALAATACALAIGLLAACKPSTEDYIASAQRYFAQRNFKAAAIEAQNAVQQNREDAEARLLLGLSLLELGDPASAERHLTKAAALGHAGERVHPALARALAESGQWERLVAEMPGRPLADPAGLAEVQNAIGRAYLALGRAREAGEAFERALAARPDDAAARVGLARIAAVGGDLRQASAAVEAVLANAPVQHDALLLKAELALVERKPEEAAAALERLLQARPDSAAARHALLSILVRRGDYDGAARHVEDARKVAATDPRLAYWEALLALMKERDVEARRAVRRVLEVEPDHVPSLVVAAAIEMRAKAYETAESLLRKALNRAPDHSPARRLMAELALRTGRPDRALEALQPLLGAPNADAPTLALAGEAHAAAGSFLQAADFFLRAREADADNVALRTRLAQVRLAAGDSAWAVPELEAISRSSTPDFRAGVSLAVHFLQIGESERALATARVLEAQHPDNPLALQLLGSAWLARGDVADARAAFERLLGKRPADVTALVALAQLDLETGASATARARFERARAGQPENAALMLAYAGWLRSARGDPVEIVRLLEQAVRADPANAVPRIALIEHHLRAREPAKAVAAANDASAALPGDRRVLEALGAAHQAAGAPNQAIDAFRRLAARSPRLAAPLVRLAGAYAAANDYASAERALQGAIALEPGNDDLRRGLVLLLAEAGRGDEAIAEARRIQSDRPRDALGFALEGDAFAAQKRWREAAPAFRAAMARAPNTGLVDRLDAVLANLGTRAEADALIAQWLRENARDVAAHAHLAQQALLAGRYPAAARHYRAVVDQRPADVVALNNLAWALAQLRDPDALRYAEQARRLAPNNAAVLDTLGRALAEAGDFARSVEVLKRAVRLSPGNPEIRLNLAAAYAKSGQRDAARHELAAIPGGAAAPLRERAAVLMSEL